MFLPISRTSSLDDDLSDFFDDEDEDEGEAGGGGEGEGGGFGDDWVCVGLAVLVALLFPILFVANL